MSETFTHRPVLLDECIEALNIRPDGIYLDGTLGRAGHSREIARRLTTGRLICVDRDQAALDAAQDRLKDWMDRVTLVHSNFDQLDAILDRLGLAGVDGMLFDLGVSSPQLDDGSRGFSYMADAPLDMRMDRSEGLTAADVVNQWSQEELRRILSQYGEERYAPSIAAAIVRRLNPDCGFVLLDKLEQMDMTTLQEFSAWLEAEHLQAIATRVSTGSECQIIIEDGMVKDAETSLPPVTEKPQQKSWTKGAF